VNGKVVLVDGMCNFVSIQILRSQTGRDCAITESARKALKKSDIECDSFEEVDMQIRLHCIVRSLHVVSFEDIPKEFP